MKRLLSWLLVLVMVFGLLPMSAFATGDPDIDVEASTPATSEDFVLDVDVLLPTEPEFGTAENPLALVEGENEFTVVPGTIFYATYPNDGKEYTMTVTGTNAFSAWQFMMVNGSGDAENSLQLTLNNSYANDMGFGLRFESTAEVESVDLVVTLTAKVADPGTDPSNPIAVSVSKDAPLSATANITAVGARVYYAVTFVDAGHVKFEGTNGVFGIDSEGGETLTVAVEANQTAILEVSHVDFKAEAVAFTATYLTDAELADIAAAEAVTEKLKALVSPEFNDSLEIIGWVLNEGVDAAAVAAARAEYEALSDGAKALVEDIAVERLAKAEELTKPACDHDSLGKGAVCDVCGLFKLFGTNLTLGNNLDLQFAALKTSYSNWDGCYFVITREFKGDLDGDGVIDAPKDQRIDYSSDIVSGNYIIVKYLGLGAKEMCDSITVVIYNSNDEQISIPYTDSIETYALRSLRSSTNDLMKTCIVDMLVYGGSAQTKFGYAVDYRADKSLTEVELGYASELKDFEANYNPKSDCKYVMGTNLTIKSNIVYQLAHNSTLPAGSTLTVSYTNHLGSSFSNVYTMDEIKNGNYYIVVPDSMVVSDARQIISVVIKDDSGNEIASYSDSIKDYLARSANEEVFFAAMRFFDSAKAYLHRNDPK